MKLRSKGNLMCLRLTRSEVARMAMKGSLKCRTDFGSRAFRSALVTREDALGLSASFEDDAVLLSAPRAAVARWTQSEELGLDAEQTTREVIRLRSRWKRIPALSSEAEPSPKKQRLNPHPLMKLKSP